VHRECGYGGLELPLCSPEERAAFTLDTPTAMLRRATCYLAPGLVVATVRCNASIAVAVSCRY
jgi:hypothetical protein